MLSRGFVLHPTLPVVRVTRRKFRMAQDSDDLDMVHILVWILVLVLVIVALHCVELYGDVPSDVIKVLSASWD